jgi:hypothetical protein
MSWDIIVQDLPSYAKTLNDIPDNFMPKPIGSRSSIIEGIKYVVPFVDFTDPSFGKIEGDHFSIEIALGSEEEIMSFIFIVRGFNIAPGIIADILRHLKLRALDINAGSLFDLTSAEESFKQWQKYRNQVIEDRK